MNWCFEHNVLLPNINTTLPSYHSNRLLVSIFRHCRRWFYSIISSPSRKTRLPSVVYSIFNRRQAWSRLPKSPTALNRTSRIPSTRGSSTAWLLSLFRHCRRWLFHNDSISSFTHLFLSSTLSLSSWCLSS